MTISNKSSSSIGATSMGLGAKPVVSSQSLQELVKQWNDLNKSAPAWGDPKEVSLERNRAISALAAKFEEVGYLPAIPDGQAAVLVRRHASNEQEARVLEKHLELRVALGSEQAAEALAILQARREAKNKPWSGTDRIIDSNIG